MQVSNGALSEQATPGEWQQGLLLRRPQAQQVPAGATETQLALQEAQLQRGPWSSMRVAKAGCPCSDWYWGRTQAGILGKEGKFESGFFFYQKSLSRPPYVCYWVRTLQVSPTGVTGLEMADLAMSHAWRVEANAVFSRPGPGSHSPLSAGLPGAVVIPRHQTQGQSLSSLTGAMFAVPPPAVGRG